MNLSDFSLLKESDDHYIIGHPKGRSLNVSKSGLSEKAHALITTLKRHQEFQEGTEDGTEEETEESSTPDEEDTSSDLEAGSGEKETPIEEEIPEEGTEPEASRQPAGFIDDAVSGFQGFLKNLPGTGSTTGVGDQGVAQAISGKPVAPPPQAQAAGSVAPPPKKEAAAPTAPVDKRPEKAQSSISALKASGEAGKKALLAGAESLENLETPDQIFEKERVKDAEFEKAYADKEIDPSHLMNSLGTESKIAAGIAMILGGIGSGMTGGPNLAFQAIQKSIDRDIDAQRENKSGKLNLWKMNRQAYGSKVAANIATSKQLLNVAIVKAKAAAAMNPSLIAQAKMAPAIAAMEKDRDQKNFLLSQMTGPNNGSSTLDPATLVSSLVPKHLQKQAFAEIKAAQDTKRMGGAIMEAFENAAKENTILRTGAGLLRTPGSVFALHQHMQPTFKDLEGTVRQAAMDNTFKNITPAPGDTDHTINQKRNALRQYLRSKSSAATAKGFGIDLNKFQSTSALGHEPGSVIKLKNGKKYKVGQDGDTLIPL